MELPPCGIYRTIEPIGPVPAGRLVYFHNHGNPGAGIYLPESWELNRATFKKEGVTLPHPDAAKNLRPLLAEGLYRVGESFTCCDKNCRVYEKDLLVQLGYNGEARPILFSPEWSDSGLVFPDRGQFVDDLRLARLEFLIVPSGKRAPPPHLH